MIKAGLKDPATGNSLFSPISILSTVNMLLLGTRGQTREEVLQALHYPRYTSQVHRQFREIMVSMNRDIGVTVATMNALFTQVHTTLPGLSPTTRSTSPSRRPTRPP